MTRGTEAERGRAEATPNDNDREARHDRRRRTAANEEEGKGATAHGLTLARQRGLWHASAKRRSGADGGRERGEPHHRRRGRARRREAPQCRDADSNAVAPAVSVANGGKIVAARRSAPHLRQPRRAYLCIGYLRQRVGLSPKCWRK